MAVAGMSLASAAVPSSVSRVEMPIPWSVITRTAPLTIKHPVAPRKPPMTG